MLTLFADILCVIGMAVASFYTVKLYKLFKAQTLLLFLIHVIYAGLLRGVMILCKLGIIDFNQDILSSLFVVNYILFPLAIYFLWKTMKEFFKNNNKEK